MATTSLNDFLDFVSQIHDDDMLEIAEGMLLDIVEIERMKEMIEKLEDGLSEGKRAVFWMEAMGLGREEIDMATNKIKGRRRFLKDKIERENLAQQVTEGKEPEYQDLINRSFNKKCDHDCDHDCDKECDHDCDKDKKEDEHARGFKDGALWILDLIKEELLDLKSNSRKVKNE